MRCADRVASHLGLGSAAGIVSESAEGHAVLATQHNPTRIVSALENRRCMRHRSIPSSRCEIALVAALTLWLMTSCRKAFARLSVSPLTAWQVSRVFLK